MQEKYSFSLFVVDWMIFVRTFLPQDSFTQQQKAQRQEPRKKRVYFLAFVIG